VTRVRSFSWKSTIPHPIDEVFSWHTRPGAFERLNAPWRPVRVVHSSGTIRTGAQVEIKLPLIFGVGIPWRLTHTDYQPPLMFRDEQIHGPFISWRHTHSFTSEGSTLTTLSDDIEYQLPIGTAAIDPFLQRELRRLFTHRHAVLAQDLISHAKHRHQPRQTILIAGASGFIGKALCAFLKTAGHTVRTLVRRPPLHDGESFWDPRTGTLDAKVFSGVDAGINLCGENVAAKRWSYKQKILIEESRVKPTNLLAHTIATLATPPKVFISASGAGFYGDTGDRLTAENGAAGSDFLSRVCVAWERAAEPLLKSSCRTVQLRIGMVLNAAGGALSKMLPAFKCGVGGRLGGGHQYTSWISLHDLLGVFEHAIFYEDLKGPVNCVSPQPCTNQDLTKTLGQILSRPTPLPMPAPALRLLFGEMSQLLLTSSRIHPQLLLDTGYCFAHSSLEAALRFECGLHKRA